MEKKGTVRFLRVVSAFALIGTVASGALLGWAFDPEHFDIRVLGAVAGAIGGVVIQIAHLA